MKMQENNVFVLNHIIFSVKVEYIESGEMERKRGIEALKERGT